MKPKALAELKALKQIVIKPADKRSLNLSDYMAKGMRQLSDPKFYIKTDVDLTSNTHYCSCKQSVYSGRNIRTM